jgi:hypothetical protein
MDVKQPDDDTVVNAIHETLHRLYGQPITALLMWQPPGSATMNLASNAERQAMIKSLRQAAENMELGPLPDGNSRGRF